MSCGCGPGDASPPDTTPKATGSQAGNTSTFGGQTVMPRNPCSPAPCPPPAISESPNDPYCPGWTAQLTSTPSGAVLVTKEGCLYKLRSRCSGLLSFDHETEQVSVEDPRLVSAVPRETRFGFLAKVVPTVHSLCPEAGDECAQEVRQELAAQFLGLKNCGELAILTGPTCGELPPGEDANADNQVRVDKMEPADGASSCLDGFHFLGFANSTITAGNTQTVCRKWFKLPRIKLRLSGWKAVKSGSADDLAGLSVVLVKVGGGTEADPCYELRAVDGGSSRVPVGKDCGDSIIWNDAKKQYASVKGGLRFFPLDTPQQVLTLQGSTLPNTAIMLNEFPKPTCPGSPIFARLKVTAQCFPGPSGSPAEVEAYLNSVSYANMIMDSGTYSDRVMIECSVRVTEAANNVIFNAVLGTTLAFTIHLMGYEYGG